MLKNFIKVTLRSLRRNSLYSVINISGLSIGIACSILILLWVQNQTSFNKFIPKSDRLFQVWVNSDYNGTINSWNSVPLPTYEAMKNTDANILNSAVLGWGGNRLLTVGETRVMQRGYFASNEFLEMFEFPMMVGDRSQILDKPASIVISEKLSDLLFKDENPIGELIRLDDASSVKVTGVFKDVPQNSSFQFDYVIPWKHRESIEEWVLENKNNWGNYSFQVYVELTDAASENKVEASIKDLLTENGQDDMPRAFFLHPMLRWRLHSNFENGKEAGGMHEYVTLFSVIALFIIIIACINFMNLATARSERRAKEVGVRKSLGSTRSQLIFQFYGESLIISLISFILAIFLVQLVLPAYNNLVDLRLAIDYTSSAFWLFALLIIFVTGVISGSYPSLYLSSFNPVKTLKGKVNIGKNANTPRKVLVMLQFGFAAILVISTIVIVKQIDLAKNRDLGYNQEGLITIPYTDALSQNYNVLKNDLLASSVVASVTRSNSDVTSINSNNFLGWPGKPESQKVIFVTIATEYDYAKTIGAEMLYGRDFQKSLPRTHVLLSSIKQHWI